MTPTEAATLGPAGIDDQAGHSPKAQPLGPEAAPRGAGSPSPLAPKEFEPIRLAGNIDLQRADTDVAHGRREYSARFITAGRIRAADNSPGPSFQKTQSL